VVRIEHAGKSDAVHVLHLIEHLLTELADKPYTVDASVVLPIVQEAIDNGRYTVILAREADDKIVGVLTLGEVTAVYAGGRFGIIHELYVSPGLR